MAETTIAGRQIRDASIVEDKLSLSDNTTGNVSTLAHGFVKKLPGDSSKFLDGTGNFTTPSGGGSSASLGVSQAFSQLMVTSF